MRHRTSGLQVPRFVLVHNLFQGALSLSEAKPKLRWRVHGTHQYVHLHRGSVASFSSWCLVAKNVSPFKGYCTHLLSGQYQISRQRIVNPTGEAPPSSDHLRLNAATHVYAALPMQLEIPCGWACPPGQLDRSMSHNRVSFSGFLQVPTPLVQAVTGSFVASAARQRRREHPKSSLPQQVEV